MRMLQLFAQKAGKLLSLVLVVTALAACSTSKVVRNINNGYIPNNITSEQTVNAIKTALFSKGWTVDRVEDNTIIASISPRTHSATIRIDFDDRKYTIKYVESRNLEYRQYDNTIHRNYNKWVLLLDERISFYLRNPSQVIIR